MKTFVEDVCGIKTEFIVSDGNSDPIFIFHGNSSSAGTYKPLLSSEVGRQFKLVSVSFPGHGRSSYFGSTHGVLPIAKLGEFTSHVTSLFNATRYILVGQSVGGHALLESLSNHRKAIGLCLVSAPPFSSDTIADAFQDDPTGGLLFKHALTEEEVARFAGAFIHQKSASSMAGLMQEIRQTDGKFREELGVSLGSGMILDEIRELKSSGIPTLLLQGDHDQFISNTYYDSLEKYGLPVRVTRFPSAGHAIQLDSPQEFERVLGGFFSETFRRDSALGEQRYMSNPEVDHAAQ